MKVDWSDLASLRAYRERLMLALEHADYLSPVAAYQRALWKVTQAIAKAEQS